MSSRLPALAQLELGGGNLELVEAFARAFARRMSMADLGDAYRRRVRVRGRGTARGRDLAIAYFRRFAVTSPMMRRPPLAEGRA